jgi:hypothetical protein
MLLDAVLRFQANARGELLPAKGPVKVVNEGRETPETDQQADVLEDLMNYYTRPRRPNITPTPTGCCLRLGFRAAHLKRSTFARSGAGR